LRGEGGLRGAECERVKGKGWGVRGEGEGVGWGSERAWGGKAELQELRKLQMVKWVVDGENEEGKNMNSDEGRVVIDIGEEDWEWLGKVEIRKGT
jgi:hypothetical protein